MAPPSLNQTMIRVKDPKASLEFYQTHFDMTLIEQKDFSDFSLFFLVTLPEGHKAPETGSDEAKKYLKAGDYGMCLELTHNHGTENNAEFSYHNGNTEPRGFGHIGFLVDDLDGHCEKMEAAGVKFQKKPKDGKMHTLAFALDPDNYWVEIIQRSEGSPIKGRASLQQTMLRVKDGKVTEEFYQKYFGMTTIDKLDFPEWKFSLTFLATISDEEKEKLPEAGTEEAHKYLWSIPYQTLELTHNYGTENDDDFKVNNGNVEPHRGFGHVAFMVEDVYETSAALEEAGVGFKKRPDEGRMKGLAFALDPDGYWIEIIKRGPQ